MKNLLLQKISELVLKLLTVPSEYDVTSYSFGYAKGVSTCEQIIKDTPEPYSSTVYTPEKWLIWSIEHNAWWSPNECGYTIIKSNAGVYSYEKACEIVAGANRSNQDTPNEAMIKIC